jgi:hypothetical protein
MGNILMETPDQIREKIKDLELQLQKSIEFHRYKKVEVPAGTIYACKSVMFLQTNKMIHLLNLLDLGNVLICKHPCYQFKAKVYANQQRNRITVNTDSVHNKVINEDNIFNWMLNPYSEWFIDARE